MYEEINDLPKIINGGIFSDDRGKVIYNNDFKFSDIERFYIIHHKSIQTIRAWHGHKYERKCFFVIQGSFIICSVKIDNWERPSKELIPISNIVHQDSAKMLIVPAGYANGLKALEENSKILVFSNKSLEASLEDDYRFDPDLWFDWHKTPSF